MYFARRPSARDIELFLRRSQDLPLSYGPVGVVREPPPQRSFDEQTVLLGRSPRVFERACTALADWRHFEIGWVEKYPRQPSIAVGTVVAVLIRHLGFWSLNGCRVVYHVGDDEPLRCGYAYGTLPNHAEGGEELFEIFMDPRTGDVLYRIRAVSWPQSGLARLGQPIVRALQARFRRDSAAAMIRATRG